MYTGMLPTMQHHRRPLRETLAANVADVRPFADVRQQVNLLRAETSKRFPADRAQVRLLAGVSPQVFRQAVFRFKLHATLLANVLDLVQLHVVVQVLLRLELLLARLTGELLHLRLVLVMLVKVQRALAGIRRAADVAHARLGIVVLHVSRVIRLYLEHLPALVTLVIVVLGVFPDVVDLEVRLGACLEVT